MKVPELKRDYANLKRGMLRVQHTIIHLKKVSIGELKTPKICCSVNLTAAAMEALHFNPTFPAR